MSWTAATLKDVVTTSGIQTGPFGSQLHAHDYTPTGVGVVMPQDLGDNVIVLDDMARIDPSRAKSLQRHRLVPGDIVFSRRGDVTKRSLIRDRDGDLICGTGCLRVRIDRDRANPAFIAAFLALPKTKEWLVRHAVGATMPNLNTAILGAVPLRVPELATQDAIAEVLGALDDKIAANQRLIAAITDLTLTRYQQLSPRPGRQTLAEVTSIGGGATPSTKNPNLWDGDVAWATPTDVTGLPGDWITATERTISETGLKSISSPLYPRGSILMTSRATIGAFALAAMPMTVNQGFIVLNAVDASLQMWLYAQLRSRVTEFKAWANGATFLELSKSVFKKLPFHEASMEDMLAFSRTAQSLLLRSEQAQKENTTLTAVRDELLPQLMSGRITVKDAEKRVQEEV